MGRFSNKGIDTKIEARLFRQMRLCDHALSYRILKNSGQRRTLSILNRDGTMTQRQLMDLMGIRASSLCTLLRKLELKNYIIRTRDENDRRNLNISITPEGQEALAVMQKEHEIILEDLYCPLTPEDKTELSDLLQKLLDYWDTFSVNTNSKPEK